MNRTTTLLAILLVSTLTGSGYSRGPAHATRPSPEARDEEARLEVGDKAKDAFEATLVWERLLDSREENDYYVINSVKPENRPQFLEALGSYGKSLNRVKESLKAYAAQHDPSQTTEIDSAQAAANTAFAAEAELADIIRTNDGKTMFEEGTLARVAASQAKVRDMLIERQKWGSRDAIRQEQDEKEAREKAAELQKELPEKIQKDMDQLKHDFGG